MNLNTPTYKLSGTTSSSSITLSPQDSSSTSLVIVNLGPNNIFLVSGATAAPTAVFPTSATIPVNGQVVPAGAIMTMTKNENDVFISGITDTGTAAIHIAVGAGE